MTKKTKKLLLLFGILLLLLGILFGIQARNKHQEEKDAAEKEAAKIYVTDLKNVSEVRYNVGNGEFVFAKQNDTWFYTEDSDFPLKQSVPEQIYVTDLKNVSEVRYNVGNGEFVFAKQNDTWFYTEDSDFPLKQSVPEQIIDTFGKLEAQRELKDGDSLEAYGLKNPVYTVSLTTTDGTQTTLQFGNAVDDSYYLTVEGTNRVYTVAASILDELRYTMDELAQFDTYPEIGSGNLLKETITENGKTTTYDSEKEEDTENIAAVAMDELAQFDTYPEIGSGNLLKETITENGKTTTYDSEKEEDTENIAAVAGGLGAVKLDTAAEYSVTDEDLPKFGLDEKKRITVEVTYKANDIEDTMNLYIGNTNGSDKRYVMINDSRIVYLISDEVCKNILNVDDETE